MIVPLHFIRTVAFSRLLSTHNLRSCLAWGASWSASRPLHVSALRVIVSGTCSTSAGKSDGPGTAIKFVVTPPFRVSVRLSQI